MQFRIGGSTVDRTYFDASVTIVERRSDISGNMKSYIGPNFFKLSENCPEHTMVTYSVNLKHDSLTNTMAETTALFNAFPRGKQGSVKLELLEIGNEPDFYFHSVDAYAAQ